MTDPTFWLTLKLAENNSLVELTGRGELKDKGVDWLDNPIGKGRGRGGSWEG